MNSDHAVTIRKAQLADIPQIQSLLNHTFGEHPGLEEKLNDWLSKEHYSVRTAQGADRLLGVTCVTINKSADLKKYECFGARAVEFMTGQALGWFQLLAVDPEYRKSGIGKALALEQVQWLKQNGCNCLMGTSWQNGSQDNSRHLFEKARFEKLGESREFLRKQSQETGYTCSVCGGPCQCNSILYGLKI